METYTPTSRTQVRRLPKRGAYDKEQVHAILDEGYICHVGFVTDSQPFVIPTGYARFGDQLYIHGSAASRMLRSAGEGVDVCVTVTLVDGFVLARSVFHHSMNYRSVVVLGKARLVTDLEEKRAALRCFTNHIVAGRWEEARQPTDQELKATSVLALPLEEVSAKSALARRWTMKKITRCLSGPAWYRSGVRSASRCRMNGCCQASRPLTSGALSSEHRS